MTIVIQLGSHVCALIFFFNRSDNGYTCTSLLFFNVNYYNWPEQKSDEQLCITRLRRVWIKFFQEESIKKYESQAFLPTKSNLKTLSWKESLVKKKKTRQVRSCSFNLHSGQKLIIIHKNIINQTLVNYSIWQLLLFLSLKNYHLFVRFFLVFVCGSHRQELNVLIQRNVDRVSNYDSSPYWNIKKSSFILLSTLCLCTGSDLGVVS